MNLHRPLFATLFVLTLMLLHPAMAQPVAPQEFRARY